MSIDAKMGIYHCFGCGESGTTSPFCNASSSVRFPKRLPICSDWLANRGQHPKRSLMIVPAIGVVSSLLAVLVAALKLASVLALGLDF